MICKNLSHAKIRWKYPFRIFQRKHIWHRNYGNGIQLRKINTRVLKKRVGTMLSLSYKQKQFFIQKNMGKNVIATEQKKEFRYLPNFFLFV